MQRRKFIQNSIGATVTGSAVINGLYMNQLFGNPLTDLSMIDIPSPNLNRLVVKPIMTNMYHTDECWNEDLRGCAVSAYIVGKDSGTAHAFLQKQADYGNHLCMVYGDYSEQIKKLGQMMNIDVIIES